MHYWCCLLFLLLSVTPVTAQPLPPLIPYTDGKLWGYADTNGHVVIVPQWPGVALFRGNTAVVMSGDSADNPRNSTYALIDKKGAYIIPPSRNWNGTYAGWRGGLNASDGQGNQGMIDTLNNIEIPFAWQNTAVKLSPDSLYKAVAKDGLTGVINRDNQLIVPCRYQDVSFVGNVNGAAAFMVRDTGNATGGNVYGVIDAQGTILVPIGYNDILYGLWTEGEGFRTRKVISKEPGQQVYEGAFISAAGGEERKQKDLSFDYYRDRYIRQGNYYLYQHNTAGYALLDTNRKVVIPCCKTIAANEDTVFLYEARQGDHAETVTYTYLDARTLAPLAAPRVVTYYREERRFGPPAGICGNGVRAWAEARKRENALPEVNYEGRYTRRFFKDSLFLEVQGYAGNGPFPGGSCRQQGGYAADMKGRQVPHPFGDRAGASIIVYSSRLYDSTGFLYGRQGHSAIVDLYGRYVVPPLPAGYYITGFNPCDGLVAVKTPGDNSALLDTGGALLSEIKGKELRGAYTWKGRNYTYVVSSTEAHGSPLDWSGYYVVEKIKLADEKGNIVPATAAYEIQGAMLCNGKTTALTLTDTAGMMGIFSPGGENMFPEVNFKHRFLNVSPEGMILARDTNNGNGKLLNIHGRDLLNGMPLRTMVQAIGRPVKNFFREQSFADSTVDGLYIATAESGASFYIDRNGRIYKAGLMTTVHKKERNAAKNQELHGAH